MLFELAEEHRMLKDLVAKFVDQELIPLEPAALAREIRGEKMGLSAEEEARLHAKCKELGLWGLDVPEEYGGAFLVGTNAPVIIAHGSSKARGIANAVRQGRRGVVSGLQATIARELGTRAGAV